MKITITNIKKGIRYLKHYGLKEFLIRLEEKKEQDEELDMQVMAEFNEARQVADVEYEKAKQAAEDAK